jgi:RNA polymerase sigma-70 factor (ECF subfamily)
MTTTGLARAKLSLVPDARRAPARVELPDDVLVRRVLAGNGQSRELLYRKHVDYIAGMSARLLRSIEGAEDVVQDTFVIAFKRLHTLRDPGALRGWLASIAVSQVRRRLAKQRLFRAFGLDRGLDDAPLDELAVEDTSAEVRSELAALDLVLGRLPPNHRVAWMLRHVEDEPLEAIAVACGCSLATAKRWIAAADVAVREYVFFVTKEGSS